MGFKESEHTEVIPNRRKFERVLLTLKIRLQKGSEEIADFDWIRNVSMGGAYIETKRSFHVDDVLNFTIYLEGGVELLSGRARVVRCALEPSPGIAIEFLDLEESKKKNLEKILKR